MTSLLNPRFTYTKLERDESSGKRLYVCPDGTRVPSVTTILDATKSEESKAALANWRKAIGEQKAQQITTEAANRGTRMHKYLEDYVDGAVLKESVSNPYAQQSLVMAKKIIQQGMSHVNEVWGSEVPVHFPGLYAGTIDLVGVWDGKPAIMDYKQSNKPKSDDHVESYKTQLCAYALAHNEVYGTNIRTGVIMMCVKPDEVKPGQWAEPKYQQWVIDGNEFDYWTEQWLAKVEQYYSQVG